MAIRVEGQKDTKIWTQLTVGAVVVVLLITGTYYLFFKNPPLVDIIVPPELETISKISKVDINPEVVTKSELYKSLVEHVAEPVINGAGRENPFARF